jgi:hypothetical protein
MRIAACPRLGRPARTPPHIMEIREERQKGLEEIRAKKKIKRYVDH